MKRPQFAVFDILMYVNSAHWGECYRTQTKKIRNSGTFRIFAVCFLGLTIQQQKKLVKAINFQKLHDRDQITPQNGGSIFPEASIDTKGHMVSVVNRKNMVPCATGTAGPRHFGFRGEGWSVFSHSTTPGSPLAIVQQQSKGPEATAGSHRPQRAGPDVADGVPAQPGGTPLREFGGGGGGGLAWDAPWGRKPSSRVHLKCLRA